MKIPRTASRRTITVVLAGFAVATAAINWSTRATAVSAPQYDLVILHGRVIDPESGLDAVRNIGITSGSVKAITSSEITGGSTIEAKGLAVAPGFIDLHQHGQDEEN